MENLQGMTRRRMLQLTGLSAIGAAALAGCAKNGEGEQEPVEEVKKVRVYDPTGGIEITQAFAPRLDTIEGKTIAFVSNDGWEAPRTFEKIKELFAERYPSVTILSWENWAHGTDNITKDKNGILKKLQEAGVDAAIVGNAG